MNCKLFIEHVKKWKGKVCICGAGDYGSTWVYELLKDAGFNIVCYLDNYKAGGKCCELPIYPIEYIKNRDDFFCFISTHGEIEKEMVNILDEIGFTNYFHFESVYAPIEFAKYLEDLGNNELIAQFPSVMDDEKYLETRFNYRMGYKPNLKKPITYNEKLQWLKLHDRNPLYTSLVDKYEVKKYVKSKIGENHVIQLYGVWDNFDQIDFDVLPNQFVLKCTHDSGGMVVCKNKDEFDKDSARKTLEECLGINPFWADREWPYKNVKPRIIAEKYIPSLGKSDSVEYKITCFNGKVEIVTICKGIAHSSLDVRTNDHFDRDFNKKDFYAFYKNSNIQWEKPKQWEDLIKYAEILAEGIPQVRVDFYIEDENIYFGELTFYTWSGCLKFVPEEVDRIAGDMLKLPKEE